MSSGATRLLRALPTMLRVGVAETVAYRGEFLVWMLTSTMPLIMLGLWTSVADEAPFQQYTSANFIAYYLATLIVRQLTGNWVAWQMAEDIRMGVMSIRLLRPIHPFFAYATTHIAAIPFRSLIALPIALIMLISAGGEALTHDPIQLALTLPSIALAWLVTFGIMFAIGALGFWFTQTMAVTNLFFGLYMLLSGYLIPLDLMQPRFPLFATIAEYSPFPCMLSTPVELMTKHLDGHRIFILLAGQAGWAVASVVIGVWLWNAGVRRFEAVGG